MSARSRRLGRIIVVLTLGLSACAPAPPRTDLAREWLKQADSAAAEIDYNEDFRLQAQISIAETYARLGDMAAAQSRLQQLEASIAGYQGPDIGYRRGMARGRVAAARQTLGLEAGDTDLDAALTDLQTVEPAERRAYALVELARRLAADRLDGGVERVLEQAGSAAAQVDLLASRSALYRQMLDVYRNIDVTDRLPGIRAEIEASAWLEEDVVQQPVAIMRLAEVQALSGLDQQARATMAVLPANYHPAIEAALAIAAASRGECAAATAAAAAIAHPASRSSALIGVLEQQARGRCRGQVKPVTDQILAAFAGESGSDRVIQHYALARALIRLDALDQAAKVLGEAVALNRSEGNFWNFDDFAAANLALADAGALDQARSLAQGIEDADRRQRHLAALAAIAARLEAARGDTAAALKTAIAIADPVARVSALVGMANGMVPKGGS